MRASDLHKPPPHLRLNPSHTSIKPAQTSTTPVSESLSCLHQTCTNLTHSCVWILLIQASNLHKPHPLLHLIPSHTRFKPAQTSPTLASESFSCLHQTFANLNHSCLWIRLIQASNLHKAQPLLHLIPSHTSIKPAQTSPFPASQSLSCEYQTCTNLTHSCAWILFMLASNLRKPQPLLPLNPSHTSIKLAQSSTTPASDPFSYKHQTCTNLTLSCVSILIMRVSNLHKPQPLLRLNPYHTSSKPAKNSLILSFESFSCLHQTCTNLTHSCVWIPLKRASNLHKPHPLLRMNLSHACKIPVQTSPTLAFESFSYKHQTCKKLTHSCVWILLMLASNLHKPHSLLRLNPSQASVKSAQTSPTPASESFSCKHLTCTNLNHSCIWFLLIQASNLHKLHPLLRLNPSHAFIKSPQTSPTHASQSLSCVHQTCRNLTHTCVWILLTQASNLHKPHTLLRLNPSHTSIKPAQTSPSPASQSLPCEHQTCTNLAHSGVWILLRQASNLHKPHYLLRLNPSHTSIKSAKNSLTLAFEYFSCKHQTCKKLTHSCVWILLMLASNLHKPHPLLRLDPSHASIKPAQTSPTLASESLSCKHLTCTNLNHSASDSFSYKHQTCTNLTHSCVWILLMLSSNLRRPHPFLRLDPSHASIKPAQTSPTLASESLSCKHLTCTNLNHSASDSFSYKHQTCTNRTHSCVWILPIRAKNLHKHHTRLRLNLYHACIKLAQTSSTPASVSLSCVHQTFTILPQPASESFSYKHQTCADLTLSCVWILLMRASNLHKPHPLLRLNPCHASI